MPEADNKVTLGGQTYEVLPAPLGELKKLLPAFTRAGRGMVIGHVDEQVMDDIVLVLASGLGMAVGDVEQIRATVPELFAAVETISLVNGLKPKEDPKPGEAVAGSTGTSSTPG